MQKYISIVLTFVFALGLGTAALPFGGFVISNDNFSQVAYADSEGDGPSQSIFEQHNIHANTEKYDEATNLVEKIRSAANIFAAIVLAVSIIMIIIGGLQYILSSGDPGRAERAKLILIYSGVGIVVSLSAFAIARLFASFNF